MSAFCRGRNSGRGRCRSSRRRRDRPARATLVPADSFRRTVSSRARPACRVRSHCRLPECAKCRLRRAAWPSSSTRHGEPRAKLFNGDAGLLGADVLHAEPEDPRELGEVVDVAAAMDECEHVAPPNGVALLGREAVSAAIGLFVAHEREAIPGGIERVAHLVQRVALLGFHAVEDHGARNLVRHGFHVSHRLRFHTTKSEARAAIGQYVDSLRSAGARRYKPHSRRGGSVIGWWTNEQKKDIHRHQVSSPWKVPSMRIRSKALSIAVAVSCLALAGAALAFDAVTLEDYSGAELFDRFCASCHGSAARGDGPVAASLNVAVPDLTLI